MKIKVPARPAALPLELMRQNGLNFAIKYKSHCICAPNYVFARVFGHILTIPDEESTFRAQNDYPTATF